MRRLELELCSDLVFLSSRRRRRLPLIAAVRRHGPRSGRNPRCENGAEGGTESPLLRSRRGGDISYTSRAGQQVNAEAVALTGPPRAAADMRVADQAERLETLARALNGPPAPRPPPGGKGCRPLPVRRLEVLPLGAICGDLHAVELIGGVPPPGVIDEPLRLAHPRIEAVELVSVDLPHRPYERELGSVEGPTALCELPARPSRRASGPAALLTLTIGSHLAGAGARAGDPTRT